MEKKIAHKYELLVAGLAYVVGALSEFAAFCRTEVADDAETREIAGAMDEAVKALKRAVVILAEPMVMRVATAKMLMDVAQVQAEAMDEASIPVKASMAN
jgi:hypothetical protein